MNDSEIKKILHVTFNMEIGGTEQVICQIVEKSNVEKFAHEILCIDGKIGPLGQELKTKGFHVASIRRRQVLDYSLIRYIHNLVLERDISVLHCHQYTPYFYGALGVIGTKVKLIFTEHGRFYPDRHNFKRRLVNPLLALRTKYITAISKATADALAKYEYISRKKIKVIYNGIKDLSKHSYSREELLNELGLSADFRYLGTIARLEPIKNQSMMIEAFNIVKHQVPGTRLLLIGDGTKRADLEGLVKSLGIEDDVIFTGYLDNPQKYLMLFEIFLLSSFSEGASMTLLEAMSLSKPCVVTNVGGNPEITVDHGTGFVVPTNDTDKFALAIINLLEDDSLRLMFGVSGRMIYLSQFTARRMTESYEKLYF